MKEENKISIVNKSELSKVHNNLLNEDQLAFLMRKTRKDNTYTRPAKGGGVWTFVTGSYVKKVLNLMFGWDWDFEIIEHKFDLAIRQAYVLGKLSVRTGGKEIKKMQFGRVEIKFKTAWENGKKTTTNEPLDIGNDLKAAATDCLKKCANELGIAADIYNPNEFKEIHVIGDNTPEEKLSQIKELINDENVVLADEDRMYIELIIEKEDSLSYDKAIKTLRNGRNEQ